MILSPGWSAKTSLANSASNTSFHLAEYRVAAPRHRRTGAAVTTPAGRRWVSYDDVDHEPSRERVVAGENRATQSLRDVIVNLDRFIEIVVADDVEDRCESLFLRD